MPDYLVFLRPRQPRYVYSVRAASQDAAYGLAMDHHRRLNPDPLFPNLLPEPDHIQVYPLGEFDPVDIDPTRDIPSDDYRGRVLP